MCRVLQGIIKSQKYSKIRKYSKNRLISIVGIWSSTVSTPPEPVIQGLLWSSLLVQNLTCSKFGMVNDKYSFRGQKDWSQFCASTEKIILK